MTQNTSSAVMAQRVEPPDSLDYFPTPPWVTRALLHQLVQHGYSRHDLSEKCWEPACGEGDMVRPLRESFADVYASDCHDYGWGHEIDDFLSSSDRRFLFPTDRRADWIITNPPFRLAERFALAALDRVVCGVALLVRLAFLESKGRHERLFMPRPPLCVLVFTERVTMLKGQLDPKGSGATAYCWLVWEARQRSSMLPKLGWIPPCRCELERPGDYTERLVSS